MPWPHAFLRSTPVRLAVFLVALFALVSLVSFGGTYLMIRNSLYAGMRANLEQQMAGFSAAPSASALAAIIANQGAITDPGQRILTYLAPDGQVYGNTNLERGPEGFLQLDLGPATSPRNYLGLAGDYFGGRLIVAENRQTVVALGNMFLDVLILSLLPTFAVALGGGLWLARRSKSRVERITQTLESLTSSNLAARVASMPSDDDLALIGAHIDRMAARQQSATEALRQVSADTAHDLKTPIQRLSVLLNQLEAQPDLSEAGAALATHARTEADRIAATFQSLLQIAQIEGGSPKARFTPVDLTQIVHTFTEIYLPSAEDRHQTLTLTAPQTPVMVLGDQNLLGQALANLIENALRHPPEGSAITVTLTTYATQAVLTVADTGPGIPAEERQNVLRRLYRLEQSRTTAGSGLGLSLVAVIADLHGATLTLEDNAPGLVVRIALPLAPGRA